MKNTPSNSYKKSSLSQNNGRKQEKKDWNQKKKTPSYKIYVNTKQRNLKILKILVFVLTRYKSRAYIRSCTVFQIVIHTYNNSKTTQKYLLSVWVFVLKVKLVNHHLINASLGLWGNWVVSCWAAVVKCQKSKMFKFRQFCTLHPTNIMSDRRSQPVQFNKFQKDIGCLWKGDLGTKSTANQ